MKVKVRSIGAIRQVLGQPEVEVSLPEGTTVGGLLDRLAAEKGEAFARYAPDPEQSTAYAPLRVLVNGHDVPLSRSGGTVLDEADDVLIFAPIAGG